MPLACDKARFVRLGRVGRIVQLRVSIADALVHEIGEDIGAQFQIVLISRDRILIGRSIEVQFAEMEPGIGHPIGLGMLIDELREEIDRGRRITRSGGGIGPIDQGLFDLIGRRLSRRSRPDTSGSPC